MSVFVVNRVPPEAVKFVTDCIFMASDENTNNRLINESESFTLNFLFRPYYYYHYTLFTDSSRLTDELRSIDLPYLMEQRFRHTAIRENLKSSLKESVQKCDKCLQSQYDDYATDGEEEVQVRKETAFEEGKENIEKVEEEEKEIKKSVGENGNEEKGKEGKKMESTQKGFGKHKQESEKDTSREAFDYQKKMNKQKKKSKKLEDLDILDRFWFKRDPSPPPRDELEEHLDELRTALRKELSTILFLIAALKEREYVRLRECERDHFQKSKIDQCMHFKKPFICGGIDRASNYNAETISELFKANPELWEAKKRIEASKPVMTAVEEDWFKIATNIEKQIFSLIPGVSGLTALKNFMVLGAAWEEISTGFKHLQDVCESGRKFGCMLKNTAQKMSGKQSVGHSSPTSRRRIPKKYRKDFRPADQGNDKELNETQHGTSDASAASSSSLATSSASSPSLASSISAPAATSMVFAVVTDGNSLVTKEDHTAIPDELFVNYLTKMIDMLYVSKDTLPEKFENSASELAEQYLDEILKQLPDCSMSDAGLRIPCFDPSQSGSLDDDEKYKVEILKATTSDLELICHTAALLQTLLIVKKAQRVEASSLHQLRKLCAASFEVANAYRDSCKSGAEKAVGRVGCFLYRITYRDKTETYTSNELRNLIIGQLPPLFQCFARDTNTNRLKNALSKMKERRRRKH